MTNVRLATLAATFAVTAMTVLSAMPAQAKDFECDFRKFRKAQEITGPALIAEVPKSMTPIPLNAVKVLDKSIAKKVLVQALYARQTETGTLEVKARLLNCTDYPLQVEGRSSFMDGTQFPLEDTSSWNRVFLPPHGLGVYSEKSISSMRQGLSYYLIELREGD